MKTRERGFRTPEGTVLDELGEEGGVWTVDARAWKGDQDWNAELLLRFAGSYIHGMTEKSINTLYRIQIRLDPWVAFQSYGRLSRWDGSQWQPAYEISGYALEGQDLLPRFGVKDEEAEAVIKKSTDKLKEIAWELEAEI